MRLNIIEFWKLIINKIFLKLLEIMFFFIEKYFKIIESCCKVMVEVKGDVMFLIFL